tara:strand:- start:42386 stop:43483 length:1098 start_codon:yes stop_codon:yes gene_type:complete
MNSTLETDYKDYIKDGIFYFIVWGNQDPISIHNAIKDNADFHTLCVLGPQEHESVALFDTEIRYQFLKGYLELHNKKLIISMGATDKDYNYRYFQHRKDVPTIPWDTFLLNYVVRNQADNNRLSYGHTEITKAFTSLNNRGHDFRLRFLDHMSKHGLMDKGFVSFHNDSQSLNFHNYKFRWWKPRLTRLDKTFNSINGNYLIPPLQWKNSLWSVVSESNTETVFVTEKTYLPIWHKRPFITYSAPYYYRYLKELGFKLYDSMVDYSFDEIDDDDMRCDMMMRQVKKITTLNHQKVLKKLQPTIEYNFRHMCKLVQDNTHLDITLQNMINNGPDSLSEYRDVLNYGQSDRFRNYMINNNMKDYLIE